MLASHVSECIVQSYYLALKSGTTSTCSDIQTALVQHFSNLMTTQGTSKHKSEFTHSQKVHSLQILYLLIRNSYAHIYTAMEKSFFVFGFVICNVTYVKVFESFSLYCALLSPVRCPAVVKVNFYYSSTCLKTTDKIQLFC